MWPLERPRGGMSKWAWMCSVLVAGIGVMLLSPVVPQRAMASQAEQPAASAQQVFEFDIPAQPLAMALDQYLNITGLPALFPSELLQGRTASAVRGHYPAEVALQQLLQGTGLLAARRVSVHGQVFVLREETVLSPPSPLEMFRQGHYAAWIQRQLLQALCENRKTRPGNYSALLRFRVMADGQIQDARLLEATHDARRDKALMKRLQGMHVERLPPPEIRGQPLTLAILPGDEHSSCR